MGRSGSSLAPPPLTPGSWVRRPPLRATRPRCFVLCGCMLSMISNCDAVVWYLTLIFAGSVSLPFIPGHTAIVQKKKKSPVLQNKLAIIIMLQTFQVLWGHQLERNLLWTHSTRVKLCLWWKRKQHMVSWHSPPPSTAMRQKPVWVKNMGEFAAVLISHKCHYSDHLLSNQLLVSRPWEQPERGLNAELRESGVRNLGVTDWTSAVTCVAILSYYTSLFRECSTSGPPRNFHSRNKKMSSVRW